MVKKILILFFFISFVIESYSFAQSYVINVRPFGQTTWTYANLKGEILFQVAGGNKYDFSEDGLVVVYHSSTRKYSFLNLNGEELPVELERFYLKSTMNNYGVKGFNNGMVAVGYDKKWGYLNTEGKIAIPLKYDYASVFSNDHAIVKTGETFIIIDKQGNESNVEIQNVIEIKQFKEGLAPFKHSNVLEGFIDINGKIVIQPQFLEVGYFNSGLAWAKDINGLIGFIDYSGKWVIKPQFLLVGNFDQESGMARIKIDGVWKYVNKEGEILSFNISEICSGFSEGLAKGLNNELFGFYIIIKENG